MPFKLYNTLASFQGYIEKILGKKFNIFVMVYFNNIIIFIKNLHHAYINAICLVLNKIRKHCFFIFFNKCCFFKDEVYLLEDIVSA